MLYNPWILSKKKEEEREEEEEGGEKAVLNVKFCGPLPTMFTTAALTHKIALRL